MIGAGWWAVANHIPVLKTLADCEIVAVNRLGKAELAEVQERSASTAASRTIARCSTPFRWTASSLPRPTSLHFEHASAALAEGLPRPRREAADHERLRMRARWLRVAEEAGREIVVALRLEFQAVDG